MSQARKHRGRQTEHLVADYLRERGWPYAEAVGAGRSGSDITGTPDVACEVKARASFDPLGALRQAHDAADGRLPFAVLRMNGQGPASVDEFVAVMRFGELVRLLRMAGYGDDRRAAESAVILLCDHDPAQFTDMGNCPECDGNR